MTAGQTGHPGDGLTNQLSDEALAELRTAWPARSPRADIALVLYHRDGVRVAPLAEGGSVVVGRSHPADLTIRDASLSRQHACFEVVGGRVWVEDLESTNGTWVAGERVDRIEVFEGAELYLGAVMATVQRFALLDEALELVSHDRFLAELEAEVRRALAFGRRLSLLMVGADSREQVHVSRWLPRLRSTLRPFDRVALYSSKVAEAILPEASVEVARDLAAAVASADGQLRCGLAVLGDGIGTADALLEAARTSLQRATKAEPVDLRAGRSTSTVGGADVAAGVISESPSMKKLLAMIARVASTSIPVLVLGETGVGKEVVAHALHESGKRKDKPLVAVNCGAIPDQLVESTLFGHERGAFTGASQQQKGVFEAADGGTVLLDEVGELPAAAQASLLRVLETKRITRVGSTKEIAVDVRVVAATHRDLEALCDEGAFRRDLLYRLDALSLSIPPLRERPEDIAPLARRFLALAAEANGCDVSGFSDAAMEILRAHDWPGNARELRNTVERATVIAQGQVIGVEDLPERLRRLERSPRPRTDAEAEEGERETLGAPNGGGAPADDDGGEGEAAESDEMINLKAEVQAFEAELIRKALRRAGWKRREAAQLLGIPRRTLADKIQAYDIKPE
jgi:DNA-binding NtrC family response regulator